MQQKCNTFSLHKDFTLYIIQASLNIALHAHYTLYLMHTAVRGLAALYTVQCMASLD